MANLADFVFLDSSSTVTTSNTFYVPYGASDVVLQVKDSGTPDVTVKAKVDRENGDFEAVGVIALSDYSTADKIEANGIYLVPAAGLREMRVVNGNAAGSVVVFCSAVGEG